MTKIGRVNLAHKQHWHVPEFLKVPVKLLGE